MQIRVCKLCNSCPKCVILNVPNVFIVAATRFEVQPLLDHYAIKVNGEEGLFSNSDKTISALITGVGMVNTAFCIGKYLQQENQLVINAGICGAFNRNLKTGQVVSVISDTLSEMGAENDREFIQYADLNLGGTNVYHYNTDDHVNIGHLEKVKGITVNRVHGREKTIAKAKELFDPDVESMEGAAFFRSCKDLSKNYIQLRAISNYVEKRDKGKWDIPLAIKNLNNAVIQVIEDFKK